MRNVDGHMGIARTVRYKLTRLEAELRYALAGGRSPVSDNEALLGALGWLCRCQSVTGGGGFARAYSLRRSWKLPYPETTGYIIPTFLNMADRFPQLRLRDRAVRAGAWLEGIQFQSGAICAKQYMPENRQPSIFNTGMVLHGWVSLMLDFGGERWLLPARKAADWIVTEQEDCGAWIRNAYLGIPHAYYTMVDWALLRMWKATGDVRYRMAAMRNLAWVCEQQKGNGWIDHCEFFPNDPVTTHTLSYTSQGLLESGVLLEDAKFIEAAEQATRPLLEVFRSRGNLPAVYSPDWRVLSEWQCLTGNAQTALVWKGLGAITGDATWTEAGEALDGQLMAFQKVFCRTSGIDGAIPGSWPVDGEYDPYAFPNHAAKFFVDSVGRRSWRVVSLGG